MQAKLVVVEPGHFHAALLQKEMYASLSKRVSVYAPLGRELIDYLGRICVFNSSKEHPTDWELDIHTTCDPLSALKREPPGNVVVFAGRNRGKIERILAALSAGQNVFADKPWIISSADMPKLEEALELADRERLAAYDIMTERFEPTSQLQRVLINTPEILGQLILGDLEHPGIHARSVHHVMKVVAGVPLRRPEWFFDVAEYGEGLADVGTHVIDLVQWIAFQDQSLDYRSDIRLIEGRRWPLVLSRAQFQQITGQTDFPAPLIPYMRGDGLDYFCNNSVSYTLRGIHVKLDISWSWEAPAGLGDIYEASFRGTKARVEIRQGAPENYIPELYVVPESRPSGAEVLLALRTKVAALQNQWPGLALSETPQEARLLIPEKYRVGHEAHFAQVARQFFEYLQSPGSIPAWERPNMLAKYYVSTMGVEFGTSYGS